MFKRANRMTTTLFKLLDAAKGEHTKNFFIKSCKNTAGGPTKFAVVVSKKVSGSAVVRNRVKRRIRAAIGHIDFTKLKIGPLLVVINAKKGSVDLSSEAIKEELGCTQVFHSFLTE